MDHMDLVRWVAPGVEAHWLNQAAQKGDSRAQYQIARSAGEEGIFIVNQEQLGNMT